MSDKEISALQPGADLKPGPQSTIAAPTDQGQTPRIPEELSILPVRGFVVFPGTVTPLNVQRAASLKLLDDTLPRTKVIALLTQRDETKDEPAPEDLYPVGTAARVLKPDEGVGGHIQEFAGLGYKTLRANTGCARPGAFNDPEHR